MTCRLNSGLAQRCTSEPRRLERIGAGRTTSNGSAGLGHVVVTQRADRRGADQDVPPGGRLPAARRTICFYIDHPWIRCNQDPVSCPLRPFRAV